MVTPNKIIMDFAGIPFEEIAKRLFRSRKDVECYKVLVKEYYSIPHQRRPTSEYKKCKVKSKREELLRDLGELCRQGLPEFQPYNGFREVILYGICHSGISKNAFNEIFGIFEGNEKELYDRAKRLLKRAKDFKGCKIVDTSSLGRRHGVRFADFTIIKKKLGRRYEVCSIDVKTKYQAYQTFLEQAQDYSRHSDYTWLMCTAGLVLDLAKRNNQRPCEAEKDLISKCKTAHAGILVVDTTTNKLRDLALAYKSRTSNESKFSALKTLGL